MSKALQILLTGFLLAGALLIVAVLWQVASPWKGFDDDRRIVTIPRASRPARRPTRCTTQGSSGAAGSSSRS